MPGVVKMSIVLSCLVLLCCSWTCAEAANAEQDMFMAAVRTKHAPVIDGNADDRCWDEVESVGGFTELNSHLPAKRETRVKCVYDSNAVYFLFICDEDKNDLVLKAKKHDDPVWFDSCVELFISPDKQPIDMMLQPGGMHFGHFIFNAKGVKFDKIGDNAADGWNPKWEVKTRIQDNRWVAEVALSFAMIPKQNWQPYRPADLTTWKMQIARSLFVGKKVQWTTAFKGMGRYADMSCFGSLVFSNSGDKDRIRKQLDWNENIKPALDAAGRHAEAMRTGRFKRQAKDVLESIISFEANFKAVDPKRYSAVRTGIVKMSREIESTARTRRCQMVASAIDKGRHIALAPQPAMKDKERVLPDFIPSVRSLRKSIDIRVCPGEYEPASFVIWANRELNNVSVDVGELRSENDVLAEDAVDLRWVKCWYQGAQSGPTHSGKRVLTPELLVKNPELVKVDFKSKKNVFRHKKNEGDKVEKPHLVDNYPDDAKVLLPLKVLPRQFAQQVWLTVRVPDDTPAGTYRGTITVNADNSEATQIEVRIEVLGFRLKPNPLISGLYLFIGGWDDPLREDAVLARMKNLVQHGISNPSVRCEHPEKLPIIIERMRKAGLDTEKAFILTYRYWVDQYANSINPEAAEELTAQWLKYAKKAGVKEIYLYLADEAQGKRLKVQERYAPKMREMGAKTWVACYRGYFPIAGEWIDAPVIAGNPVPKVLVDMIHKKGNIILSYANPQCGSEMPEIYRRNYGLLLWASGYDGSMNYNYWGGFGDPWDDFDHPFYRDHNMAYPTKSGMVDTIQWEGWREGVDDCRYLATLLDSIKEARKQGRIKQVRLAEAWVVDLKKNRDKLRDLDSVRREMIFHIERCKGLR